ncbi:hypothetical protein Nm8I071_02560 [Nonomuraea sp. TT08I-71]|nr:hypothetical protein Nm8I071_02560 [Nonomuraea sp. TT08I-71]
MQQPHSGNEVRAGVPRQRGFEPDLRSAREVRDSHLSGRAEDVMPTGPLPPASSHGWGGTNGGNSLKRRIVSMLSALALAAAGIVVTASPAAAATCTTGWSFRSGGGNGLPSYYVSAELGYVSSAGYGELRARATSIGPWEKFTKCDYASYTTFKSEANGKYVHVNTLNESGGTEAYMLRASASTVGINEKFTVSENSFTFTIASQYNDMYVAVEYNASLPGDKYMLRARSTSVGLWEQFTWCFYLDC